MSPLQTFLTLDFPALAAGVLAAVSCALVGCFLVLRRMSLMGDAISHAALPGLVLAFLLAGAASPIPMLLGAVAVGVLTTVLTETIHRWGRVEPGASMGVVFTVLFAIGVLLLEQAAGRNVHLDADCVLYGQMEDVAWINAPASLADLFTPAAWEFFPREVATLALALTLTLGLIALLFKELRLASFDPALATTQGFNADLLRYVLMTLTAVVAVASFEAVGSILVVGMLVVPAMIAHLLVNRLAPMLAVAAAVAAAAGAIGYAAGAFAPRWLPVDSSLSAAGMIGVALGVMLALAALFAPTHGLLSRRARQLALAVAVRREDLLADLHRAAEQRDPRPALRSHGLVGALAERSLLRRREAARTPHGPLALTPLGAERAARVVRAHRLWEAVLVDDLGLRPDHVHRAAERLEHLAASDPDAALGPRAADIRRDPHGKPIPAAPHGAQP